MKKLPQLLVVVLSVGSLFAWYTVYQDFSRFYGFYHTIFRVKNCSVPNPVVTPCFYGAFAFVIALIWSLKNLKSSVEAQPKGYRRLLWFLVCANIFAWSNFSLELIKWLRAGGKPIVGCSGLVTSNPFATPCFIGSAFFFLALLACVILVKKFVKPITPIRL